MTEEEPGPLPPQDRAPRSGPSGLWDAVRAPQIWVAAVSLLGVSLWAQLLLVPLAAEWGLVQARPWALIAYAVPLPLLAFGLYLRSPLVLLGLVPLSLLPAIGWMPEQERLLLHEPWALGRVSATLALYVALASAGSGRPHAPLRQEVLREDEEEGAALVPRLPAETGQQLRFVHTRLAVLLLLLLVPAQAIFASASVDASMVEHYGAEQVEVVRTFLGLLHFFVWCVAAYMMVLVPAINLEYDQRRLARAMQRAARRATPRRAALKVGVYGLAMALLLAWAAVAGVRW